MLKVLIVDDQPAVRGALQVLLEVHGLSVIAVGRPEEVLDLITTEDVGLVIQDMNFTQDETSGEEGARLFRAIKQLDPDMPVLLITAWTSLEAAVQLVKEGASDYMAKPWDDEKLVLSARNLLQMRELQRENIRLRAQSNRARRALAEKYDLRNVVYASEAMHAVVSLAVKIAAADVPVLVTGPNGCGKEKVAEIIQANSRRRDAPYVTINAGALPSELVEAELFGAESGAYTGATKLRVGRFEAANGGTLLLDEIGTLPLAGQAKLLRVLQTGEFERLGSSVTRKVDVRIISATNLDMPRAIAAGTFREDLFFRLNVIEIYVPPLADRMDDAIPLAEFFLGRMPVRADEPTPVLGDEARTAIMAHDWPGNVRELQNRMQRATLVCRGGVITGADLGLGPDAVGVRRTPASGVGAERPRASTPTPMPSSGDASQPERALVEDALVRASGVVSKAAAELGVSRQALYRRMERLGIVVERRTKVEV